MAEILMSQAEFEEIRQCDYCKSREEFVKMLALGKAYFTSRARVIELEAAIGRKDQAAEVMANLTDRVQNRCEELEAELAKIKAPEYSRPQQGPSNCRANGVVIR